MKVVGMSATPFRMGQGLLTNGGIFTDICYDVTGVESFNLLIAEGYLSPLIPKKTKVEKEAEPAASEKLIHLKQKLKRLLHILNPEKMSFGGCIDSCVELSNILKNEKLNKK